MLSAVPVIQRHRGDCFNVAAVHSLNFGGKGHYKKPVCWSVVSQSFRSSPFTFKSVFIWAIIWVILPHEGSDWQKNK
jgi:hypothetical protein